MPLTGFRPLWKKILSRNLQSVADQGCHLKGSSLYKGTVYRGRYCIRDPTPPLSLVADRLQIPLRKFKTSGKACLPPPLPPTPPPSGVQQQSSDIRHYGSSISSTSLSRATLQVVANQPQGTRSAIPMLEECCCIPCVVPFVPFLMP
jgi:hypothetical protein